MSKRRLSVPVLMFAGMLLGGVAQAQCSGNCQWHSNDGTSWVLMNNSCGGAGCSCSAPSSPPSTMGATAYTGCTSSAVPLTNINQFVEFALWICVLQGFQYGYWLGRARQRL